MKRIAIVALGLVGFAASCVAAHFAAIELGREVVTLRTQRADGTGQAIRLWAVDDDGAVWVHSGGDDWLPRFASSEVTLERGGVARRYRATPMPGPHERIHELLRAKYGWVDRWVRFLGPDDETVCAVRLDPIS
ncbi:MAG: hypothetical protein FJ091_01410 [Deltaproteobacteria bacterium]|nr:hypothetical protein [Deltaproteobacteria bacterium]